MAVTMTLAVSWAPTVAADEPRTLTRVRGAGTEMHALILDGDRRSSSFRALVDEIQKSDALVMVQFGLCGRGRIRSCVSHVGQSGSQRHIRVLVNTRTTDDRLVATIAHELHHAVEIIREPRAVDTSTVLALYRRIANGACGEGLSERCETDAAMTVEAKVLDELSRVVR